MKKILLGAALLLIATVATNTTTYAQHNRGGERGRGAVVERRGGGNVRGGARGVTARRAVVPWGAAHRYAYNRPVYFPNYRLYYDPTRGGYLYWNSGQWLFSSVLPAFMAGVDLAAASMSYANSLPPVGYYPQGGYVGQPVAPLIAPGLSLNLHLGL